LFTISHRHRHPRPTHFPYTTLFRSFFEGHDRTQELCGPLYSQVKRAKPSNFNGQNHLTLFAVEPYNEGLRGRLVSTEVDGRRMRDRKSTRLNSSHLVISYAVFCLKT